uniref:XIAP associated factor 1 n=1 Tax=Spermophilus dauricus TaxID=99837 RepID=A0A8C9NZ29_SPEDA
MEGDFQVCGNCRRSVASDHFTLHEAHCLRFLVLCPECEEPIPKSKMKEHFENEHQQGREFQLLKGRSTVIITTKSIQKMSTSFIG